MAVGFHDAYVAAPSQKAAIEAWGSDKGVFARGEAEIVTDPALMAEPLASPGKVIKRLRGTAAEQIAALVPDEPVRPSPRAKTPKPKPVPRPSRARLEDAEKALAKAQERQSREMKALAEREAELARERLRLERQHREEAARLSSKVDEAAAEFEEAMRAWRG